MLNITWDEKRCGYWIAGAGFDFFAYYTSDGDEPDDDTAPMFLECDHVQRQGEEFTLHLRVSIKRAAGEAGIEIIETKIVNELGKYWDLSKG